MTSAKRKRLLVAVDARSLLRKEPRGEGKTLLRLYSEISRQREDIEAIFFGDGAAADFSGRLPPGVRLVVLPTLSHRANLWEDVFFPLMTKWMRCDVMHCTSSGSPARTLIPMVMTVHDLIPLMFDDGQSERERRLFAKRLARGLRQAKHVMTVSEHTRKDLLHTFAGIDDRVTVVPWGCDPRSEPAEPPSAPPTVMVFGGEARRKNTDYTIDRYIAAARRLPDLRLQLVGITSALQRQALQCKIDAAGLADQIFMPGFVSERALATELSSATLLLYLSLYEGFGLPILEAVSCGLPVVASDRTSIPELLSGAPGCYDLTSPTLIEDAIVRLSSDRRARELYAAAQAAILPRFDWSITAQGVCSALQSAVS